VILRSQKGVMTTLLALTLAIIFVTPFVYFVDPRKYLPVPFSDYLNSYYSALFPLFPWSAYSFLGTVLCWVYLKCMEVQKEKILFKILAVVGLIFFISSFLLFYVPWQYSQYVDPARSSPRHFMMKIGFVFMVLSGLWYYEQKKQPERSVLSIAGQESLLVYGLHLVIVYGASFMPHNIASDVGHVLSFTPALVLTYTLVAAMIIAALWWHWMKTKQPRMAKAVFYALCAVYFVKFFLS
jgi:fucose 4-O-acetylase-like acetyltransferase